MKNNKYTNRALSLKLLAFAAVGCVLLCNHSALAASGVINFDVEGGYSGGPGNYTGQGAYPDAGNNYWNPIVPNGTTPTGTNSDGVTLSPITFAEGEAGHYDGGGSATTPPVTFLEDFFAYANNDTIQTCALQNVPAGTYLLYLYGKNDNEGDANRGAVFSVTTDIETTPQVDSTTNSVDTTFTLHNDYVVFKVGVGAGGTITFTYTHNANIAGNNEGDFNGLQLVPSSAVVNFDVEGGYSGGPGNYSGQGAYSDVGNNYWNPIVPDGTTTAPALTSDGVTASPITFTEGEAGHYDGGGSATTPPVTFLEDFFAYANNDSIQTCALQNVPAGTYLLYLYGKNDNEGDANRGAVFSVTTDIETTPQVDSTTNSVDTTFTLHNDYVLFNVTVGAGETITFTYTHNANIAGNNEGDFNGLQLVQLGGLLPPIITEQPTSEEIYAGETATFTGAATAQPTGTVTYQWQTNGVNLQNGTTPTGAVISGATSATLTVANAGTADQSASYVLMVTANDNLTVSSSPESLIIVVPSGEPYEASVLAQHPVHFYEFNELANPASGTAVAYDYIGGDNGTYGVNTLNGYDGIAGPTPSSGFPGFSTTNTAVEFNTGDTSGADVSIDSPWNLDTDTVTITAWINPDNGTPAVSEQFVFCRGSGTVAGFGYGSMLDTNGNPTLGYTWNDDPETYDWNSGLEVPANQWSFVSLTVTSTNATISIMNTNGLASATHVYSHVVQSFAGTTMVGDDPADVAGINVFPGTIDDVAVFNKALSFNQLTNVFETASDQADYPPLIADNPTSISQYLTLAEQFTVNAGGSGILTYQWQADGLGNGIYTNLSDRTTSTGSIISGSLTPTLSVANIGNGDASDFRVVVSSQYAPAATSTGALLTVLAAAGGAQNITLAVNEPAGEDWNSTNWSDGLSAYESTGAYPGSTFEVLPNAQVRTVDSASNIAFPGEQLTIDGVSSNTLPGELLLNHTAPNVTFTFPSLIMNGGRIDNGSDGLVTITGGLDIVSNTPIASDPVGTAINFSVPGSYAASGPVYFGQGAYSDPGHNYWNPVPFSGLNVPATSALATNADGVTISTVTMTSTYQFVYNPGGGTQGAPSGLETAYAGITANGTLHDTLNHVPAGNYLLYIYGVNGAAGNHDRATTFWVSSDSTPAVTNSTINYLAGYNQFIEGDDYIIFNVVVGAGGTINISFTADPLEGFDGSNGSGENT
jgi:hypothetical protein